MDAQAEIKEFKWMLQYAVGGHQAMGKPTEAKKTHQAKGGPPQAKKPQTSPSHPRGPQPPKHPPPPHLAKPKLIPKPKWIAKQKGAIGTTVRRWRPWHSARIRLSMQKGQMPTCRIFWVTCVDGGKMPICIKHGQAQVDNCWACREVSEFYK